MRLSYLAGKFWSLWQHETNGIVTCCGIIILRRYTLSGMHSRIALYLGVGGKSGMRLQLEFSGLRSDTYPVQPIYHLVAVLLYKLPTEFICCRVASSCFN